MNGDLLMDKVYQDGKKIKFSTTNDSIELCTPIVTDHATVLRHLFDHVSEIALVS
jgi:hypothetical protein